LFAILASQVFVQFFQQKNKAAAAEVVSVNKAFLPFRGKKGISPAGKPLQGIQSTSSPHRCTCSKPLIIGPVLSAPLTLSLEKGFRDLRKHYL